MHEHWNAIKTAKSEADVTEIINKYTSLINLLKTLGREQLPVVESVFKSCSQLVSELRKLHMDISMQELSVLESRASMVWVMFLLHPSLGPPCHRTCCSSLFLCRTQNLSWRISSAVFISKFLTVSLSQAAALSNRCLYSPFARVWCLCCLIFFSPVLEREGRSPRCYLW